MKGSANADEKGSDARINDLRLRDLPWFLSTIVAVATTASGFGIWITTIQNNQARQQQVLEQVVAFMDEQTKARRAMGSRERQRKEFCEQGVLTGQRCLFLPSETELQAMER